MEERTFKEFGCREAKRQGEETSPLTALGHMLRMWPKKSWGWKGSRGPEDLGQDNHDDIAGVKTLGGETPS